MPASQIEKKILDYWFTVEFLSQDSYEASTDEIALMRELKKFKKADPQTKSKKKVISVFEQLNGKNNIESLIQKQASECEMPLWGNLTFYIGKIKRQVCIEQLSF